MPELDLAIAAAQSRLDEAGLVQTLMDLVAIPSLSAQETPAQEHTAEWLEKAGLEVETWRFRPDDLRDDPWYSTEFERAEAMGVVATYGEGDGHTLLLTGHVDVVPIGKPEQWTSPAFEPRVADGRLHGRGACDMKAGLAAQFHAVKAVLVAGIELDGRVLVAPVVGEEDGGCGTVALLEHGITADSAIISEPTQLTVVPAVAGALTFEVLVRGRAAHGCLREEGVSAIEVASTVQRAILDVERRRNDRTAEELFAWLDRPFAICTGRIEGGDWPSSEADWCRLTGRFGVAPDEDLAVARREFEDAIAAASTEQPWLAEHPPVVTWPGAQFHPGRTRPDHPLVESLSLAHKSTTGRAALVRGMPYGCDLGITVGKGGIPTVVYGPGDIRQAHAPDEWVALDEVVACSRTLVEAIIRTCGVR